MLNNPDIEIWVRGHWRSFKVIAFESMDAVSCWPSLATVNSGLCWTVFARNGDTAVPAEGNGDLQTLICVLVATPRRCLTLSNSVPWQNRMAAYLGYTLRMKTLFRGWPIMVDDTHTRRRRRRSNCGHISTVWDIQRQNIAWPWKRVRHCSR